MKRIKISKCSKYFALVCMTFAAFFSSCGSTKVEEKTVDETVAPAEPEKTVEETVEKPVNAEVKPEPKKDSNDYTESNKKLLEEVEKARLNALKAGADAYWKKSKVFYGTNAEIARAMLKEVETARQNAVDAGADLFFENELSSSDSKKSAIEKEFNANQNIDYSERLSSLIVEYENLEKNSHIKAKAIAEANNIILDEIENTREDALKVNADTYWNTEKLAYNDEEISFPETESKKSVITEQVNNNPKVDYTNDLRDILERYKLLKRASDTRSLLDKAEVARSNAIDAGAEVYFENMLEKTDAKKELVKADFKNNPKNDYTKRLNTVISEYESMLGKVKDYIKDIPEHNEVMLTSVEKARDKAIKAGAETYLKNAKVSYVPSGKKDSEYISLANTDEKKIAEKNSINENPNIDHTKNLKDLINRYETLEKASYTQAKFLKVEDARADAIEAKAATYAPDLLAAADENRESARNAFDKDSKADYSERLNALISEYKAVAAKANDLQERELLAAEGNYISFKGTDVKSEIVQEGFDDLSVDHSAELQDLIERYKTLEKASYTQAQIDNVEAARAKAVEAGAEKYLSKVISIFDEKTDSTKVSFKSNPRGNYSKTLTDLVDKYNSLVKASAASEMKEKVEAVDSKFIDENLKKNADVELEKYISDSSDDEGKVLITQAEKAYKAYSLVMNKVYSKLVVEARKSVADAKKLAESEKAQVNKNTKEAYKNATNVYKKADSEYRAGLNEAAYNDYKSAEKSYLEQYEAVKKAKEEAIKAQQKSLETRNDAESFAAAADATNPLADKVAGIEDEDTKLLEDDKFDNPEESVIQVENVEQENSNEISEPIVEVKDSVENTNNDAK